ncbi:hypothetical protein ACFC26_29785 [Kitasatospora purpeofusca]|uniref:hypothetical protein n=1 Tax=Kitasatospora purpeofusca TaxID=67352 RepID=UPI0035E08167
MILAPYEERKAWIAATNGRIVRIGTGKRAHLGTGNDETLCGRLMVSGSQYIDESDVVDMALLPCHVCLTAARRENAKIHTAAEKGTNMSSTETDKKLTAREKKVAEVRDAIDRIPSVVAEGNEEALTNLRAEAVALIGQLRGEGVAAEKAKLRNDFDKAVDKAQKAADKAKKESEKAARSVVVTKETPDYTKIPGLVEARQKTAKNVFEGIKAQSKISDLALTIATEMLEQRVQVQDKHGDPDWDAKTKQNKQLTADTLADVLAEVQASGMDPDEAADLLRALDQSITNNRRNAAVLYVRSLDERPEEAARWARALAANPDAKPSEAVFAFTGMPQLTRAEEAKRKRALAAANANEGNDTSNGGDSGNEGGGSESTPRFFTNLKAIKEAADKAKDNVKNLKDDEARAKARAELRDLLDELAEIRGKI